MTEPYTEALTKAQQELAECDAAIERLEFKRARLRLTVADLQLLMGIKVKNEESLTEAILMIVKGTPGYVTAVQVMDRMFMFGFHVQTASIATILSRLAKKGKIISAVYDDRIRGYAWKTDATQAERNAAMRTVAEMVKKA